MSLRISINHFNLVSETCFYMEGTFTSDVDFSSLKVSYLHSFLFIFSKLNRKIFELLPSAGGKAV